MQLVDKKFTACPVCNSAKLVALDLYLGPDAVDGAFVPTDSENKAPWYKVTKGISLNGTFFQMCRDCGFLFRQDTPHRLNDFLTNIAKSEPHA